MDFTQYDVDGDGWIDNVFIFYAGYGENLGYGAPAEAVWPHSWDLREATNIPYMHDGVRLNHYACTNEILSGLGEMYVADARFTENIDRFGDGTAQMMRDAIRVYCNK